MKFRLLTLLGLTLVSCSAFITSSVFAIEEVDVKYVYAGNHGVDLSKLKGSFKIGDFSDDRGVDNLQLITDADLGDSRVSGGYQADRIITDIIQGAFTQGFIDGGATPVDSDEDMSLTGKLLSSEAQIIERNGVQMIQLTFRVNVQLHKGGRSIWQTTLFGRGRTPETEGMTASVSAALDRMINELVRDDYFLQEIR
ncbi:MAG: hypothetical protein COA96_03995 [SAR86 cluster bacterium]|uniref:ABC-type transport auxiliary lipoprotein component domain-containing protein n=1 Tax=SAR86 cluster bacterium TaxID=2030880 RepID=A0A2A5B682_9GAMM|nr:MAG: hypothetical protein COA96_03995 [SAR86 cluster bacterium]